MQEFYIVNFISYEIFHFNNIVILFHISKVTYLNI